MRKFLTNIVLILIFMPCCYAKGFFDQRYRGWFWFKNKPATKDTLQSKTPNASKSEQPADDITPMEARREIEQFAKELEELKFMMLARPSSENVKAYRDKEKQM
jgi:F plasmid transfer operon protein